MCTNIPTEYALEVISEYVRNNQAKYGHYHAPTLIKALEIAMRNSIMKFGNEFKKQSAGTAIGKPPAPAWAINSKGSTSSIVFQDGKTFWYSLKDSSMMDLEYDSHQLNFLTKK